MTLVTDWAVPLGDAALSVCCSQLAVRRLRRPLEPDESGSADWGPGSSASNEVQVYTASIRPGGSFRLSANSNVLLISSAGV